MRSLEDRKVEGLSCSLNTNSQSEFAIQRARVVNLGKLHKFHKCTLQVMILHLKEALYQVRVPLTQPAKTVVKSLWRDSAKSDKMNCF